MSRYTSRIALLASAAMLVVGCSKDMKDDAANANATPAGAAMDPAGADYRIVLRSNWTKANHPFEYPEAGALTGPHFSGIIGTSHNASYMIFREGGMPTPGLEKLSEEGKHSPLDEEIQAATSAGTAGMLFESGPLKDFADSLVATVHVDRAHPLVSFVAMVAPSPDWFTGLADVNLLENGQWIASKSAQLYAWDSGGDDGTTYKAADKDNTPKKPTMQARTRHFVTNGAAVPVAMVTITKK
jgi:hypothetical protein